MLKCELHTVLLISFFLLLPLNGGCVSQPSGSVSTQSCGVDAFGLGDGQQIGVGLAEELRISPPPTTTTAATRPCVYADFFLFGKPSL